MENPLWYIENYGKSPLSMDKSTSLMPIFNSNKVPGAWRVTCFVGEASAGQVKKWPWNYFFEINIFDVVHIVEDIVWTNLSVGHGLDTI